MVSLAYVFALFTPNQKGLTDFSPDWLVRITSWLATPKFALWAQCTQSVLETQAQFSPECRLNLGQSWDFQVCYNPLVS